MSYFSSHSALPSNTEQKTHHVSRAGDLQALKVMGRWPGKLS